MDALNTMPEISARSSDLSSDTQQTEQRFILAGVDQVTIVFSSDFVADISIVDRSQILAVPFYDRAILGIIHSSAQVVPLVSMRQVFGLPTGLMAEKLTVVRLNPAMVNIGGVGLVVDTTLGTKSAKELPSDLVTSLFTSNLSMGADASDRKMRLFQPEMLSDSLWRSLRW
jgi:chemotaxis signal transduction protein